jgi:Nuclease-related domain
VPLQQLPLNGGLSHPVAGRDAAAGSTPRPAPPRGLAPPRGRLRKPRFRGSWRCVRHPTPRSDANGGFSGAPRSSYGSGSRTQGSAPRNRGSRDSNVIAARCYARGDGGRAEPFVEAQLRAALPGGARLFASVPILTRTRPTGPAHDGEADIVIVHPEHGLLVIEAKAGEPRRDAQDRWFIGDHALPRSPFEQARAAEFDLRPASRHCRTGRTPRTPEPT